MLASLFNGQVRFPALDVRARLAPFRSPAPKTSITGADAIVDVTWGAKTYTFVVECKTQSTPKIIDAAIGQATRYSQDMGLLPMIFTPYLSREALERLEAAGISGVDLSGNGIIHVPGEIFIYQSGAPNRYPSRRQGPNPYRGASSLVARTLAIQTEFGSSRAIEKFIAERGGMITQGAISKALNELEDDLVILREQRAIRVLQYDVLLDALVRHFERPDPHEARSCKVSGSPGEIQKIIVDQAIKQSEKVIVTGLGSASHYTAMAQSPPIPIYCRRLDLLDGYADFESRFPNVVIKRMADPGVYYDAHMEGGLPWASPVQTYLELMNGGARDREMADNVRRFFSMEIGKKQSISDETNNNA
ncbi:hypothetical protein CCAX7_58830 [Capsulimonas corticalis]|uniref:Uncharacterized protein n=2 Tax=Capsulimonas corticalis TaxID=2219043 RepID=A0A402CZU6_9BACT|nr:hypothetical protein CCAX7_58830 [Capsulimonas corticalis]